MTAANGTLVCGNVAASVIVHTASASRRRNHGRQYFGTDGARRFWPSRRGSGILPSFRCLNLGEEFEQDSPEERDPAEEDEPACVRMCEEHVLQVRFRRVGVIPDKDDSNHA